uniref:Molybdenum carrier n=1 Tax=Candidatus Kentrum sp. SD TaxID=2126332 RepID=A0A451BM39_9GAMM|nr:MAG: Putative molybdenum carrier [Candidatus Kentron sp. SD]
MLRKVISGGQTGVDQAALRATLRVNAMVGGPATGGLAVGGWCPPGRECESGKIPAGFPLRETERDRSPWAPDIPRSLRTERNVRDSEATLIVLPGGMASDAALRDKGTRWTASCAARFGKALYFIQVHNHGAPDRIAAWIDERHIATLNVAGPSENTAPGIGESAFGTLLSGFMRVMEYSGDIERCANRTFS